MRLAEGFLLDLQGSMRVTTLLSGNWKGFCTGYSKGDMRLLYDSTGLLCQEKGFCRLLQGLHKGCYISVRVSLGVSRRVP